MPVYATVAQGTLKGKECTTYFGKKYYSFEGIPYAKPPLGKLRFRNPEPPENWHGVFDATKPGNRCAQINPYAKKSLEGSEDCLYLNIYTPYPPNEISKLDVPVIFFVHGGRLIFGYGDYYSPDYLLKHDVILVTINYRLNVLGFLALNIPEAPGNVGLKDTVMALRWVKSNISVFNGDGDNITVFGESAGSAIVMSYMTSNMTKGFFSKVITQSGSLISDLFVAEDDPIEKAKHLASLLGKQVSDIQELLSILIETPLEELLLAFGIAEQSRPPAEINAYFLPIVEKTFEGVEQFFEVHPRISLQENRFHNVPVLIGHSSHEAALFLRRNENGSISFVTDYQLYVPKHLKFPRDSSKSLEFVRKLREFYLKSSNQNLEEYIKFESDVYFNRDIWLFLEMVSAFSDKIYFCKFNYSGRMNTRVMKKLGIDGATHGDIIQYQFYRKSKADQCTKRDEKMVEFLSETWYNFVKNGKPTWFGQTAEWLPYKKQSRYTLLIDEEPKLVHSPDQHRIQFWVDLIAKSKL